MFNSTAYKNLTLIYHCISGIPNLPEWLITISNLSLVTDLEIGASFADLPDRGSQGAHVTFLCDKYGSFCLLAWQSRRIRRVVRPSPVDYCEDYHLIPKCHYFENLRLCRSISLLWLCPVLPGIPLLGISWYLSIFIVFQKFIFFYIECKIIFLYKMPKKGLMPWGYIFGWIPFVYSILRQGSHGQASKNFNDFSMIFQDKNPPFPW